MNEINLKNLKPLPKKNPKKDLEWFCESFGIIRERDKDKNSFKIFKILLESTKRNKGLNINEIKERVSLSRTTVIHHLKCMEGSGLVIENNREYELRTYSLSRIVDEIEKDILRSIEEIREVAEDIDEYLGISFRE